MKSEDDKKCAVKALYVNDNERSMKLRLWNKDQEDVG